MIKRITLFVIGIAVTTFMLSMFENAHARGSGGRSGGGWSSGRGGGGGGEHHGGEGERRGEGYHGGDGRHWDNGRYGYRDGGWGCGAADAAVAGVIMSEAVQPTTVIVEQPSTPVDQSSNNVDQSSNPVNQQSAPGAPVYGMDVTVLPAGSVSRNVQGTVAYQCGSVWYKPYFGSNGVYYEVVAPPPVSSQ